MAALIAAWFVVLARDHVVGDRAGKLLVRNPDLKAQRFRDGIADLESAQLLDPGNRWAALRANVLALRDPSASLAQAEAILRDEPANVEALEVILSVTRRRDRERYAEAVRHLRRISPRTAD